MRVIDMRSISFPAIVRKEQLTKQSKSRAGTAYYQSLDKPEEQSLKQANGSEQREKGLGVLDPN